MDQSTTPPLGSSGLAAGQRLAVRLERPAAQGRTVALHGGFAVLVARGAPGEEVDAELDRVEARHALAHVVSVRRAAPERVEPPCPHFERCGGCDLQHLAYPAQLAVKRQAFLDQLARIGGLEAPGAFEVAPASPPLRYRDRLDFLLLRDGDALRPAFHGAHGGPALPVDDCLLAPPELTRLAQAAAGAAADLPPAATPDRVRVQAFAAEDAATAAFAATFIAATPAAARALTRLKDRWLPALLAAWPGLAHVAVAVRGRAGPEAADGETGEAGAATVVFGEATLTRRIGGHAYRVPPHAFFQVHAAQAGRLVTRVTEELRRRAGAPDAAAGRMVLDLFCGTGLFSLPLAAAGYRVLGIEASADAVRAARAAAREAGARGEFGAGGRKPEFKARDLEGKGALEDIVRQAGRPAAIVLDPPRRGLSAQLARGLLAVRPAAIVYVSCDGATFSRDAARLAERYELAAAAGFDLFPQTHHLEVVGTFVRRAAGLKGEPTGPASAARARAGAPDAG